MLWTEENYILVKFALEIFFDYHKIKNELKRTVSSKFPQLYCDLKDICLTKVFKVKRMFKISKFNYSFGELYFLFKNKPI